MEKVTCCNIKDGIRLYHIPSDKFKTVSMSVNIHRTLDKREAAYNALLCDVMRRGCEKYPTQRDVARLRQSLYGAFVDVDIRRKGEDQIISFQLSTVADCYLPETEKVQMRALGFLFDMMLEPLVEDGAFRADYVAQEKVNLKNDIDALINDKRAYAVWRLVELMCADEPYGVHELGTKEDVDSITPQSLYAHYQKVLSEGPIDIFVVGQVDIDSIRDYISERFAAVSVLKTAMPKTKLHTPAKEEQEIVEAFDVTQAKLCLGFYTGVKPEDSDYPALMVYNGILGSGAHSKLFNNVREKLSLAYYASSRLERYKGMLVISSGIEIANKQKALDEIKVQMEEMEKGNISEYEFDAATKSIVNALRSLGDDVGYLEDYYLGQAVSGTSVSLEEMINLINKVTPADVVRVAKKIQPELVYFLTGKGETA
ncbi:MAG: insulinase family protein [Clostridia bacterium]|nr:insulinase family protein [Clostridia bacterium]